MKYLPLSTLHSLLYTSVITIVASGLLTILTIQTVQNILSLTLQIAVQECVIVNGYQTVMTHESSFLSMQ